MKHVLVVRPAANQRKDTKSWKPSVVAEILLPCHTTCYKINIILLFFRGIRNTTVQALRSKRKSKYMEARPIKEEPSTSSTIPYRTRSSTHSQSIDAAIGSQKDVKTPNDVKVDLLPLFAGGRQAVRGASSKSRTEGQNGNISSQSRKESQQGTSVPGASTSLSGSKITQNAESSRCFPSELRLPQSFCNSCEGTSSTLRKNSVHGDGSSSGYDSNEVPQSCTDLLVGEAVETEDNPSCSGSLHDVASCSQDEDSGISLRSRLPISVENVEKHWVRLIYVKYFFQSCIYFWFIICSFPAFKWIITCAVFSVLSRYIVCTVQR